MYDSHKILTFKVRVFYDRYLKWNKKYKTERKNRN